METIQVILNKIIDIGGNNGIIIAGLVVSLFVIYKIASAANCTCLEAILLDKKEKKELEVERMALFAMLFTFVNFFAMLERLLFMRKNKSNKKTKNYPIILKEKYKN